MKLNWQRFNTLTSARRAFSLIPCIYVQTNFEARPIRIGKASKGLTARYRGGTGYALDAAMHGSKNLVFVTEVPSSDCDSVELQLIWENREILSYNNLGKRTAPKLAFDLVHSGDIPLFVSPRNGTCDQNAIHT